MNDSAALVFEVATAEWLIVLAGIAAMGSVAAWVGWRGNQVFRSLTSSQKQEETLSWHSLNAEQAQEELRSGPDGLSSDEAQRRLQRYGPNRLPETKPRSPLLRFLAQFNNALIYVLLVAGVFTAVLQHWLDAGVIMGVVLINALIGFVQEGKAEDALRAIRHMLSPHAMVRRDGRVMGVDAADLVPGDLVPLQSGDKVPADLRLLWAKGLQVDEAVLTGESVPVEKDAAPVLPQTQLGDRLCMAYSGTLVTHSKGLGLVVATGSATEIGRISALVAGVQPLTTPLLRQMAQFGRWLTAAILLLAAASFAFGVLVRDYTAAEMFLASVGLAVAAIPEGLPAIMTITLAIGVQRMAGCNAIIRRLPAVETLGTVGVICSDKTGTLTRNEMTVRTLVGADGSVQVGGTGYDPHGGFEAAGEIVSPLDNPALGDALRAVCLCNDAVLEQGESGWRVNGDPMEGALLVAARKAGLDPEEEAARCPRTDLIPFESEHKFMASLHHDHAGDAYIFVKGAPEVVLAMCERQRGADGDTELNPPIWQARLETLATMGQRVLAVAAKPGPGKRESLTFDDLRGGMVLLGLFGLNDPPRAEAVAAVRLCHEAGIRVKMITGDHSITALAIAAQAGLENCTEVLTGPDLETLDEAALRRRVQEVDVFARVTPEHKLRLVECLQAEGKVVSMTGDGVNDAPALKRADVGVAMGVKGTEAAKEAAEMVLADDNFASIANAVKEGRTVYDNLQKAILFILPTNGGEALVMLGAIAFGFHQFPLTPVQILWVNMITAVTLALALAFEPPEAGVMDRPPRDPRAAVLSGIFLWRIGFVALILTTGTFSLFLWDLERTASIEHARTVAVNTLVAFEIFYLFNARYIRAPVLNRAGLLGNRYVLWAVGLLVLFQLAFTYLSPLQILFGTAAIEATVWVRILLVAVSVLLLVELEKALLRYWEERGETT